ncbi:MAG: tyrosinase family protein, partial [Planctomycetota bacterium]
MNTTRRTVLKAVACGTAVTMSPALAARRAAPPKRRSLSHMALNDPDLSAYRDFVGMMKARDQRLDVSWLGFANVHGNVKSGFKYCPHGDWYFLPWHRAYVVMYEQAVRELTGKADFAMPYWNWTEMRELPEAFADRLYQGKDNPLYVPNRNELTGNYALTDAIVGQKEVMDKIYAKTVYEDFGTSRNPKQDSTDPKWVPMGGGIQGLLEHTPHNTVHNNIGAFMPTAGSPNDPIFFMHHGNIDRIWAHWNALGRRNSTEALWRDMVFVENFLRTDGSKYSATVKDLEDILALGYDYDFLPNPDGVRPNPAREAKFLTLAKATLGTENAGVPSFTAELLGDGPARPGAPVENVSKVSAGLLDRVVASQSSDEPPAVFALLRGIELEDGVRAVRVFVDRDDLHVDVSDDDPHFVTVLSFLDHGGDGSGDHARDH